MFRQVPELFVIYCQFIRKGYSYSSVLKSVRNVQRRRDGDYFTNNYTNNYKMLCYQSLNFQVILK